MRVCRVFRVGAGVAHRLPFLVRADFFESVFSFIFILGSGFFNQFSLPLLQSVPKATP